MVSLGTILEMSLEVARASGALKQVTRIELALSAWELP
jgi:hypothetical protein